MRRSRRQLRPQFLHGQNPKSTNVRRRPIKPNLLIQEDNVNKPSPQSKPTNPVKNKRTHKIKIEKLGGFVIRATSRTDV